MIQIGGLGSVIIMPLLGTLSDAYGRKVMLTIPLTLAIIPLVVMSVKRSTEFFYVYYVLKSLTAMVTDGGVICLSLSYLADNVTEQKRISAFGILAGVFSAATVCGTLTARLLSTDRIFQVAAVAAFTAAVYMRIFLKDTTRKVDELEQPILKNVTDHRTTQVENASLKLSDLVKKVPLPKDIIRLLKSSLTLSLASFVAFFNSLAEAGIQAFLMYYLKARFQFGKDQFADIWLITYISATISSMVLMPTLARFIGEETMLCMGLFAGFLNMLLDSIAWAHWVPYASAFLGLFLFLATPSIRCIISKQVGPYEQGIAQGCLMAIASFANVISPLIYSPLSALFLSDGAPFNFPGFSILCVGLAWFIGFILSTMIKIHPYMSRARNEPCLLA
ncbi:Major facilitator superfamily protein [Striga hermonthica]|uniref:Major facilitator superfamily protein n=1 Tax=Striga hermonthica TaxID=68872 RepID=A0A9N7RFU6_STRHE|nr:Major facilitator superfamily protein [Striga hermonthica]